MNSLRKLNTPNVSLRQISMFLAVVHLNTIRSASEELNLTQGAISQGIKELEKQLGEDLFSRVGRKLVLTESGRTLLPRLEELHRQAAELNEILTNDINQQTGNLLIGASSTIGCYLLPSIIASFQRSHPRVSIDMHVYNTKDILADLKESRIDMAFVEGRLIKTELPAKTFLTDELVVFAHPNHPFTKRKSLTWKSLENETWLLREDGSGTHSYFLAHCADHNLELNRTIHIGNSEAILRCVEEGIGIACLSKLAVQRSLDLGFLKQLPVKPIRRHFYFARNQKQQLGRIANLFLKELESHPSVQTQLASNW